MSSSRITLIIICLLLVAGTVLAKKKEAKHQPNPAPSLEERAREGIRKKVQGLPKTGSFDPLELPQVQPATEFMMGHGSGGLGFQGTGIVLHPFGDFCIGIDCPKQEVVPKSQKKRTKTGRTPKDKLLSEPACELFRLDETGWRGFATSSCPDAFHLLMEDEEGTLDFRINN